MLSRSRALSPPCLPPFCPILPQKDLVAFGVNQALGVTEVTLAQVPGPSYGTHTPQGGLECLRSRSVVVGERLPLLDLAK